jgi:hypothetical protein
MFNAKIGDRSTWVVEREYQDSWGIVQTEYRDAQGNLHIEAADPNKQVKSYDNGYVDGKLVEEINQNQQLKHEQEADKSISKGLLIGVIVSCVVGMSAGVGYYLFQLNNPSAPLVVTTPIDNTAAVPSPSPPPVKTSVTNPTPTQPAPQDLNVTIKTQPEAPAAVQPAEPKTPAAAKVPVKSTPAIANPPNAPIAPVVLPPDVPIVDNSPAAPGDTTDTQLKTEIVKKLNQQFARHQLSVDVNQGNVNIRGTVTSPAQLEQIQPLLQSLPGIKAIDVKVAVKNPPN